MPPTHADAATARYAADLHAVLQTLTAERAKHLGRPGATLETWLLLAETVEADGTRRFLFLPHEEGRVMHYSGMVDYAGRLIDTALDDMADGGEPGWEPA